MSRYELLYALPLQTRSVVSTFTRRLYHVADVVRRLIDVETTRCVYWDKIVGKKFVFH